MTIIIYGPFYIINYQYQYEFVLARSLNTNFFIRLKELSPQTLVGAIHEKFICEVHETNTMIHELHR